MPFFFWGGGGGGGGGLQVCYSLLSVPSLIGQIDAMSLCVVCPQRGSLVTMFPAHIVQNEANQKGTPKVASFPGLPRFLCSSVSIIHGCGRVLLSTETEEQKKRGRPGNEATPKGH